MENCASEHDYKLSPWWRHMTILVMVIGFSLLIFLTEQTYKNAPPIPGKVVDNAGQVLFTGEDIKNGQSVFLKYGLMEHGSIWGHGSYLGYDYSSKYLHRSAEITQSTLAQKNFQLSYQQLSKEQQILVDAQIPYLFKENKYNKELDTLVFSPLEVTSYLTQQKEWAEYFTSSFSPGLPQNYIKNPQEISDLTKFFAWAAWATVTNRPQENYTYTNNFPFDPLVGNHPSTQAIVWSALSLIFLLGGIGLILFVFGKFDYLGWRMNKIDEPQAVKSSTTSVSVLTPSQKSVVLYFVVTMILFLAQGLIGGAIAHYKVEPLSFYGFNLANWFSFPLLRTWHLQLAIFWIATAWVAAGLFIAPLIGAEPKGQKLGVNILLAALVIVVFGSLLGEYLGLKNLLGEMWFWLGHQGSEYLDLGRFWQILLALGLILWLVLMFRALKPAFKCSEKSSLASLFLYSAIAIPLFYLPALFYGPHTNFSVIDNWRFWIIHLWVEGFFELFATVLVAIIFYQLKIVSSKVATRVVYLDAILYLSGGILGIAHHWYFSGQQPIAMAFGACFSALEVVPLTLLTLDAWDFINLTKEPSQQLGGVFQHKWTFYFLMSVGFWNFVGAGIFGFLINLPIISYFEVGTTLTLNHGHAAMFGVFGMLALATLMFGIRHITQDKNWSLIEKFIRVGFWGLNIGLALMIILDLFPAGVLQLWDAVTNGYWHARELVFTMHGLFHNLEIARIFGDMVFIFVGIVPMFIAVSLATFYFYKDLFTQNKIN